MYFIQCMKGTKIMIKEKTVTGVILVAGNSTRYGQNRNKNFETINGKTVMLYSLEAFHQNAYIDNIIIGAKKEEIPIIQNMIQKRQWSKSINIVIGGNSRQETVYHCIQKTNADIIIVHDGARPMIKQSYINECVEAMKSYKGATIGVPSKDTIKITDENNVVIQSTQRSNTWMIQTPQCFDRKTLLELHKKYETEKVTDDCMLLEKNQDKVKILEGDYTNIKITTYEDFDSIKRFITENR